MPRVKTEKKRREILEASAKVFSKHGFHAATVSQIADELGMGLGTFYRYFKSKLDVFHAVIEEVMGEAACQPIRVYGPLEAAQSPEDRVAARLGAVGERRVGPRLGDEVDVVHTGVLADPAGDGLVGATVDAGDGDPEVGVGVGHGGLSFRRRRSVVRSRRSGRAGSRGR